MRQIALSAAVCLTAFVMQSLPMIFHKRNTFLKILPSAVLVFTVFYFARFAIPAAMLPPEKLYSLLNVITSMLLGDITGWIGGVIFRTLIEIERNFGKEIEDGKEEKNDHKKTE